MPDDPFGGMPKGDGDEDSEIPEEETRAMRAEELGRLIEDKDWMGVLDLLEGGGTALMIGIGPEDDEM